MSILVLFEVIYNLKTKWQRKQTRVRTLGREGEWRDEDHSALASEHFSIVESFSMKILMIPKVI